jgi:uncharacterized OB-fold protein
VSGSKERAYPAPQGNPEDRATLEAAAADRLMIGRCGACGRAHYYPRSLCPFCFGEARLEEASGEGEIYTLSVTLRGAPEPYAIGYVTLKEGPRLLTNFVDAPLESFAIGEAVEAVFRPVEGGGKVVVFRKRA